MPLALARLLLLMLPPTPAEELSVFPDCETARHTAKFAFDHQQWVERQLQLQPWRREEIEEWLAQVRDRCQTWHALYMAQWQMPDCPVAAREYVAVLRYRLGEEAFQRGEMPAPVPLAWFGRLD